MSKIKVPKIKKQEIWHHYIGEEVGKTKCLCCSINSITQFEFHCGHIVAKSCGGDLSLENLRPICSKCNLSMGNENMIEFMKRLKYDTSKIEPIVIKPKKEKVLREADYLQLYLTYRFPNLYPINKITVELELDPDLVQNTINQFKNYEEDPNIVCQKEIADIYNKYKDKCLEQILNKPLEIKLVIRQNQWGNAKKVYDALKYTKKLICPWGHSKKICELYNQSKFNDKKFSKIFINNVSLGDYLMVIDRDYKTGLIVRITSEPKSETIENMFVLRKNNLCTHIPIGCGEDCDKCGQSVKMVFTKEYFKSNTDEFIQYLNEDYHFENMHSIIRDIEVVGEISSSSDIYQKYKCLQNSICTVKDINLDIKDIKFV